jgi:hypothetical protein
MASIRPLERADLPAVATMLRAHLPGWSRGEGFLARTLIDHPWTDGDPLALVSLTDDDEVVGFFGAQARRLRLDSRELRGVCCAQLVVVPDRRGVAGARLLSHVLSGPQDLTFVDSATEPVVRMWRAFGGHLDQARACDWMLVLRPARWLGNVLAAPVRRQSLGRRRAPVGAVPFQAAGRRLAKRAFPAEAGADITGEITTAEAITEQLPHLTSQVRLRVEYDANALQHQFGLVESVAGPLVRRLVRHRERPIGWYAYLPRRRAASRVLNLTALEVHADAVLGELVRHARTQGCTVLTGRLEPHLAGALSRRFAVLGFGIRPLVHTHDHELDAVLATSSSLLTELDCVDSQWWAAPA